MIDTVPVLVITGPIGVGKTSLERAAELTAIMERNSIEDMLVDIEGKTVIAIAQEILTRNGWTPVRGE